ncbi:MAG: ABC transporter permease [Vicinamibacterales bacterium]
MAALAIGAPWLAPNDPDLRFPGHNYAPPSTIHYPGVIHAVRSVSRLERTFATDESVRVSLRWFANGRLVTTEGEPLLLLGADAYGRDIFARILYGARVSLALALVATVGALLLGSLVGAIAGYAGGRLDELLSRLSDFVLVLPAMYVVLALRAVLPLVLPAPLVFGMMATIFTLIGWPVVARGVRGIIASERQRDYVAAGRAIGAGPARLLLAHLLPAARGHMLAQATLLLPAFILAEATLSYVGLGFPDSVPTWGTMLYDAANGALFTESPWMLAPAAAIFIVVLAVNLTVQGTGRTPVQLEP